MNGLYSKDIHDVLVDAAGMTIIRLEGREESKTGDILTGHHLG
jgi:hypothetical protein